MLSYSGGGTGGLRSALLALPANITTGGMVNRVYPLQPKVIFCLFGFSGVISSLVSTTLDESTLYFHATIFVK